MKIIIELNYNYKQAVSDGKEMFGEDWDIAEVGKKDVIRIDEHPAYGEGDKWYYDIFYKDGKIVRTFNPCRVVYHV